MRVFCSASSAFGENSSRVLPANSVPQNISIILIADGLMLLSCRHPARIALEVAVTVLLCVPVNLFVASDAISPRLSLSCVICKSTLLNSSTPFKLPLAAIPVNCSTVLAILQGAWSERVVVARLGCAGVSCTICQCAC